MSCSILQGPWTLDCKHSQRPQGPEAGLDLGYLGAGLSAAWSLCHSDKEHSETGLDLGYLGAGLSSAWSLSPANKEVKGM